MSFIQKNLAYLERLAPNLARRLADCKSYVDVTSDNNIICGDKTILRGALDAARQCYQEDLKSPSCISVPLLVNDPTLLSANDVVSSLADSHELIILSNAPSLSRDKISASLASTSYPRDFLMLGSLCLLNIESLFDDSQVRGCPPCSILLVEPDDTQMLATLRIIDFEALINDLRSKSIGFHLIAETDCLALQEAAYQYLSTSLPLSLRSLQIFSSPLNNPVITRFRGWLFSQSGVGHRFLGTLGYATDELNQLMASVWNACSSSGYARWLRPASRISPNTEKPALIVGSGPSLDEHLAWIKEIKSNYTIISSGSSIGTLLRSGVVPDMAVFLERGALLHGDLVQLQKEGYDLKSIRLVASITTDPRISTLFGSVFYFLRPLSAAAALFVSDWESALPHAGPESLNAALETALLLGFRTIVLAGCDFATRNRAYPRSLLAAGETPRQFDEPVRGNLGRTVFSQPSLIVARDVFETTISMCPDARVYRLGEGVEIVSTISATPLDLQGLTSESIEDPWDRINEHCPTFDVDPIKIKVMLELAIGYLPEHCTSILEALRSEQSLGWSIKLHRTFAPYFGHDLPREINQDDLVAFSARLLVHRLYRQLLFMLIAPLQLSKPGSTNWLTSVNYLEESISYCDSIFSSIFAWMCSLDRQAGDDLEWTPDAISDQIRSFVTSA